MALPESGGGCIPLARTPIGWRIACLSQCTTGVDCTRLYPVNAYQGQ